MNEPVIGDIHRNESGAKALIVWVSEQARFVRAIRVTKIGFTSDLFRYIPSSDDYLLCSQTDPTYLGPSYESADTGELSVGMFGHRALLVRLMTEPDSQLRHDVFLCMSYGYEPDMKGDLKSNIVRFLLCEQEWAETVAGIILRSLTFSVYKME